MQMRNFLQVLAMAALMAAICGFRPTQAGAATRHYVVTNDDVNGPNTVTFYLAGGTASAPKLTRLKTIKTGGTGRGGGYFGLVRQVLVPEAKDECVFTADGGSNDVAAIILQSEKVVGNFKGSSSDSDGPGGMALAASPNHKYLYAGFSASETIATFTVGPACTLTFVADVSAVGLNAGFAHGMAANGNILVVAYGDGSIGSFNISGGVPVSNNDLQFSTGHVVDGVFPDGVDITKDGHYAIFGDASAGPSEVDVSDLSSGKLATTVKYGGPGGGLGSGVAANNVWLSPDETLLYVSDNLSGQVTAAHFSKTTGKLRFGCISKPLRGFGSKWVFTSAIATQATSGSGSVLWVAEDSFGSSPSSIGIVDLSSTGGKCTLTESKKSPASDPKSLDLCWLNAFPPRGF
jgi:6-phosphogluconolactonase (cycloisomerase 2 family)